MPRVSEINHIDQLAQFRPEWQELLRQTPAASFFQSLEWLEVYWRHFGQRQKLRVLVHFADDRPRGILPLVVERGRSKVGPVRTLTFPLHEWGSFYGPIGPEPEQTLTAGLEHIRRTPRDWDILELRWQGAAGTDPDQNRRAMLAAGFQSYPTLSNRAAIVDLDGSWDTYWSARKGAWLRRFHHAERKLAQQGTVSYVRYRPSGQAGDNSPCWDLYDACEELARRSWQATASDGTTLSHESVRGFLRDMHETAAAAGTVDLNLLLLDNVPVAFIYGYHYRGYVYGLRRGYDGDRSRAGAGNVLLAHALRDSFARGDRVYDMGVGSYESKRHFQTRLIPIFRYSHYSPEAPRTQLLRLKRWWQSRRLPAILAKPSE
ncbi:MAG: GNAT family N-acetyltransferase [Thermoguttaceae bacterium]|jgi:CelD/BcsL family acetyltransferase involved in cellulose biosynthesis